MHVIAIPYIRSHFNEGNAATKLKWDEYWTYFVNTWIKGSIPTTMWNIYELKNCQDVPVDILRNRTNHCSQWHDHCSLTTSTTSSTDVVS